MSHKRQRRRPMSQINVVPYIDVMLVLLVIFMVTAPLLNQGVRVDLPSAPAKPLPDEAKQAVIVSVDARGAYFLNIGPEPDHALDQDTLLARVTTKLRLEPQTPVFVKGDERVDYGRVVTLMGLLQRAGVSGVGLITRPLGSARR